MTSIRLHGHTPVGRPFGGATPRARAVRDSRGLRGDADGCTTPRRTCSSPNAPPRACKGRDWATPPRCGKTEKAERDCHRWRLEWAAGHVQFAVRSPVASSRHAPPRLTGAKTPRTPRTDRLRRAGVGLRPPPQRGRRSAGGAAGALFGGRTRTRRLSPKGWCPPPAPVHLTNRQSIVARHRGLPPCIRSPALPHLCLSGERRSRPVRSYSRARRGVSACALADR